MELERAAADGPAAQAGNDEQTGRRGKLRGLGGDGARRVKTRIETPVEFGELLLETPLGVRVGPGLRLCHHRRLQQSLDLYHRRPIEFGSASLELNGVIQLALGQAHTARATERGSRFPIYFFVFLCMTR
jgi:hypothetical protein